MLSTATFRRRVKLLAAVISQALPPPLRPSLAQLLDVFIPALQGVAQPQQLPPQQLPPHQQAQAQPHPPQAQPHLLLLPPLYLAWAPQEVAPALPTLTARPV